MMNKIAAPLRTINNTANDAIALWMINMTANKAETLPRPLWKSQALGMINNTPDKDPDATPQERRMINKTANKADIDKTTLALWWKLGVTYTMMMKVWISRLMCKTADEADIEYTAVTLRRKQGVT